MTEENKTVSLASLLTPSKTVTLDYPGMNGFTVDVCYLAREELLKLRNRCVSQKFNRKTRGFEGWSGLKYSYLEELLLVDISALDPEDELEFNHENAETLMKNASDFDTWITEVTGDLENFTRVK